MVICWEISVPLAFHLCCFLLLFFFLSFLFVCLFVVCFVVVLFFCFSVLIVGVPFLFGV